MTAVAVVAHHERAGGGDRSPDGRRVAGRARATRRGSCPTTPSRSASATSSASGRWTSADLVVSLGGDGTMLRAVEPARRRTGPAARRQRRRLGYLTEIEPPALTARARAVRRRPEQGGWHLDERMMLRRRRCPASAGRGGRSTKRWWRSTSRVTRCGCWRSIDGEPFTSYAADGLIVATPTGSTAYSLSARGPVVSPRHRAMLLTPVSPHMLFDRTLVLDPAETVEIEVPGTGRPRWPSTASSSRRSTRATSCVRAGRRDGPLRALRRRTLPPDPEGQVRAGGPLR